MTSRGENVLFFINVCPTCSFIKLKVCHQKHANLYMHVNKMMHNHIHVEIHAHTHALTAGGGQALL